jgi:Ni/Co efflux regulator RcnB
MKKIVVWILSVSVMAASSAGMASQPGQANKTVLSQSGQGDGCKHAPGQHKKGCLQNSNVPKQATASDSQQRREPTEQRNFHR